ncbi:MAG: hypothetical protein Q9194_004668 [Teloschistes cf. exilis]
MIPRNLFLTFLSWQSAKTPDHAPADHSNALTNQNNVGWNPYSVKTGPRAPEHVSAQAVFDSETVPVTVASIVEENFDKLPAGECHQGKLIKGSYFLRSSTRERIYDVKSDFPELTNYPHNHAWGTYPEGNRLAIHFISVRPHIYSSVTFTWLVDDRMVPAEHSIHWS